MVSLEVEWWLPGEGGGGNEQLIFNGYGISVWEDEKFWMGGAFLPWVKL